MIIYRPYITDLGSNLNPDASGTRNVGTEEIAWASGVFDNLQVNASPAGALDVTTKEWVEDAIEVAASGAYGPTAVIFEWYGALTANSLKITTNEPASYLANLTAAPGTGGYTTVFKAKFLKLDNVNYLKMHTYTYNGPGTTKFIVDPLGSALNGSVYTGGGQQWNNKDSGSQECKVDVSSLTNAMVYDMDIQMIGANMEVASVLILGYET